MWSKYLILKRALDIVISYFLLLICYIPMIVIAALIKIFDGGPVIFRQIRIGLDCRPFVCYKFRTMRCDAPRNIATKDFTNVSEYVTPIGVFLRKTSLDELPQLFNVLAGDMSIVGPRPLIPDEREMHRTRRKLGVYRVRPGITGLAQVCGRDELSDIRKAECDAIYVDNICLLCDINILFGTIRKVISREGICENKETALDSARD